MSRSPSSTRREWRTAATTAATSRSGTGLSATHERRPVCGRTRSSSRRAALPPAARIRPWRTCSRFANALLDHTLLSPATTDVLTSRKVATRDGGYAYGFGIREGRPGDPPTIWHNGGAPGAGAELAMNPKLGYTIVVLANRDYGAITPAVDLILNDLQVP
jgi:CubicO group peptidase (beta-lactamase class C family)